MYFSHTRHLADPRFSLANSPEEREKTHSALARHTPSLSQPGKKYVYKYEAPEACEGSLWIGSQRYAWVDLTAGPVRRHGHATPTASRSPVFSPTPVDDRL